MAACVSSRPVLEAPGGIFLLNPSPPSAIMAGEAVRKMLDAKDMEMLAQLIDQKLDQKLEPISSRLGRLEQGQAKLEQGQNELRADVSQLKNDVSVLKCDVAGLKGDVEIIKEDTKITRSAVNTLLEWAEDTAIEVKIPLYKKAE